MDWEKRVVEAGLRHESGRHASLQLASEARFLFPPLNGQAKFNLESGVTLYTFLHALVAHLVQMVVRLSQICVLSVGLLKRQKKMSKVHQQ